MPGTIALACQVVSARAGPGISEDMSSPSELDFLRYVLIMFYIADRACSTGSMFDIVD
jgi:hypothetical protein